MSLKYEKITEDIIGVAYMKFTMFSVMAFWKKSIKKHYRLNYCNGLIKPLIHTDKINLIYILKFVFYPCESVAKKINCIFKITLYLEKSQKN